MNALRNVALNARIICGAGLLALGAVIMPKEDLEAMLASYQRQVGARRG